jgi:primosomal protein N' (replication factor Y)
MWSFPSLKADRRRPVKEALTAEVAVPVPIDKTLTYLVPTHLEEAVRPGLRVVVPVRGKLLTGVVLSLSRAAPQGRRLKAIREPADDKPVITPELMSLAGWISDYYVCPLGEVLAAMSPPPARVRRVYSLKAPPTELELEIMRASSPERARILEALMDGRPRGYETLRRKTGSSHLREVLDQMEKEGLIGHGLESRKRRSRPAADGLQDLTDTATDLRPELTPSQKETFRGIGSGIEAGRFGVSLILGVTGSGKTEVYLRLIEKTLEKGKRALYLVPEIGLTPQTIERVRRVFGERCALLHSGLSKGRRYANWLRILEGGVDVVVGARSAVFAPLDNLGLVVVDEEHDTSYKQQDSPRYNARDVAIMRAKSAGAVVVLGSATPTIESYHNALEGKYGLYELPERISGGILPEVRVIDMRTAEHTGSFSREAEEAIRSAVGNDEQVLLFMNRRGFSNYVQCGDCGLVPRCRNCYVSLTYHTRRKDLRCHYCGYSEKGFEVCPRCGSTNILYVGQGTQRVEDYMTEHFPEVTCARLDSDAASRRGSAEALLSDFAAGTVGLLVGTQMVAKGHDFKKVGLVVVISADVSMNLPDFRSGERTFQILTQVAGRAGRGDVPGKVILQTYNPEHHSLSFVANHDFKGFYIAETEMRMELGYPPFTHLVRVVVEAPLQGSAETAARAFARVAARLGAKSRGGIDVVGPSRAPLAKIKNVYRWHLILKGDAGAGMSALVRRTLKALAHDQSSERVRFSIDVDPQIML